MKKHLISASIYPVILITLVLVSVAFLLVAVVPQFEALFVSAAHSDADIDLAIEKNRIALQKAVA